MLGALGGAHPAFAGDLDGDGRNDVLLAGRATPNWSPVRTVTLAFGFAPALHERYGLGGVRGLSDLDQDGFDDYVFGTQIISGRDASVLRSYATIPTEVDDLDGDGSRDLILPEWSQGVLYFRVRSFATGQVLQQFSKPGVFNTGVHVFVVGDLDGDGLGDLVFGAPNASLAKPWAGGVFVHSLGAGGKLWKKYGRYSDGEFGSVVAALDDLDGDGIPDVAVGAPREDHGSFYGQVYVFSGSNGALLNRVKGVGQPLALVPDRNGDGLRDLATGSIDSVIFFSPVDGAALGSIPGNYTNSQGLPVAGFGQSIAVVGDYDGDGLPDLGVGAPGYDEGAFFVFASDDGALLRHYQGRIEGERLGTSFASVEVTGDGLEDVVVVASNSFGALAPGARVELLDAAQASVASYCGLQASSSGCLPQILSEGTPRRSASSGFALRTYQLEGGQEATLFIGHGQQQVAWMGSSTNLCVREPLTRTKVHSTGGSAGGCDGSLSLDFNTWMAAHPNQAPQAGTAVFAQVWFSDPGSPSGSGLSNAVVFSVLP
jgi:hypothetical protein